MEREVVAEHSSMSELLHLQKGTKPKILRSRTFFSGIFRKRLLLWPLAFMALRRLFSPSWHTEFYRTYEKHLTTKCHPTKTALNTLGANRANTQRPCYCFLSQLKNFKSSKPWYSMLWSYHDVTQCYDTQCCGHIMMSLNAMMLNVVVMSWCHSMLWYSMLWSCHDQSQKVRYLGIIACHVMCPSIHGIACAL